MTATESDHYGTAVPSCIDSPQAKLVYLCLQYSDGATIDELQTRTAMAKLSLYTILRNLKGEELIDKTGSEYRIRET